MIVISLVGCLLSFLSILYEKNYFGIKQNIEISKRQDMTIYRNKKSSNDTNTIQKRIVANNQDDWQKVGTIALPKLGILLPIYNQPYNKKALMQGAQQMPTNSNDINTLGKGNFVVVGHNFEDGHRFFSALQEKVGSNTPYLENNQPKTNNWLNGQLIYIADKSKIYEYQITKQYVVKNNNLQVLDDTKTAVINLITCLEPDDNYRIITHGELKQVWNWDQVPSQVAGYFDLKKFSYNF